MSHAPPSDIFERRLRLAGGFNADDRQRVLSDLAPLTRHLAGWSPEQVDFELSVKDRDGREQQVTLNAWLAGWPHMVARSTERDLHMAVREARKELASPDRGAAGQEKAPQASREVAGL